VATNDAFARNGQEATCWLEEVREIWGLDDLGEQPPLGAIEDVAELVYRSTKGEVLEPFELVDIAASLGAMYRLKHWIQNREENLSHLDSLALPIEIDIFLVRNLEDSFTATGELSADYYPELKRIRDRMEQLREQVRSVLNQLLNDEAMSDAFHDRYITDRGGRMVIPVRVQARKKLGIVHDTSQSGETAFVEPTAVVEQQNELKQLEAELRRTVARILTELSQEIAGAHDEITQSLSATTHIDLAVARARLGRSLKGSIPKIGSRAQIHVTHARHPVLTLRGLNVVPNTLQMSDTQSGIVLTGPNAGGKTITLKTIGLMSLMTQAGIPIPADDGARIDWFDPILAVVGDQQDVSDDLSTFSSHLVGLRVAIELANSNALILLDEIGIGTDPRQGAALAQAVIESIVESGARTIVTTHYTEVKELAANHEKMELMGAIFADGHPTFRMESGRVGRSHALAVARRMGLAASVIERARDLLDTESQRMDELLTQVESEREGSRILRLELEERQRKIDFETARLREREIRLNARRDREDAEDRANFRDRLKGFESTLKAEIKALQQAPSIKSASSLLDKVKAENESMRPQLVPLTSAESHSLEPGQRVKLIRMGMHGTVLSVKGDQVDVDIRGKRMRLERNELKYAPDHPQARHKAQKNSKGESKRSPDGIRTDSNTLDLRGMRVHEAIDEVEAFLDGLQLSEQGCAYLLHGHGTGALKTALRQWLPKSRFGKSWRTGGPDEGGDAFTVVVF